MVWVIWYKSSIRIIWTVNQPIIAFKIYFDKKPFCIICERKTG